MGEWPVAVPLWRWQWRHPLNDMRNKYTTMFFRKTFTVANPDNISEMDFIIDYDDGFTVWINEEEVLNVGGPANPDYDSVATVGHESGTFETFAIQDPASFLTKGKNVIAIMGFNVGMTSSDFMMNAELRTFQRTSRHPRWLRLIRPGQRGHAAGGDRSIRRGGHRGGCR